MLVCDICKGTSIQQQYVAWYDMDTGTYEKPPYNGKLVDVYYCKQCEEEVSVSQSDQPISQTSFYSICYELLVDPTIALEDDAIVKMIDSRAPYKDVYDYMVNNF